MESGSRESAPEADKNKTRERDALPGLNKTADADVRQLRRRGRLKAIDLNLRNASHVTFARTRAV